MINFIVVDLNTIVGFSWNSWSIRIVKLNSTMSKNVGSWYGISHMICVIARTGGPMSSSCTQLQEHSSWSQLYKDLHRTQQTHWAGVFVKCFIGLVKACECGNNNWTTLYKNFLWEERFSYYLVKIEPLWVVSFMLHWPKENKPRL